MSLDTETLSTLSGADRVNTIAKHLRSIPLAQRVGALVHAITELIIDRNPIMIW